MTGVALGMHCALSDRFTGLSLKVCVLHTGEEGYTVVPHGLHPENGRA
jgi:hypothetical protein